MYTPTEALNKLESELFDLIIFLEERSPLDALETFDDRNILASVIKILTIIIQVIKSLMTNINNFISYYMFPFSLTCLH
jgi:hypothetical protein